MVRAIVAGSRADTSWATIAICSFPSTAGILFGYDSGWIAGVLAMRAFKRDFGHPNSTEELAWNGYLYSSTDKALITSILSAGTFCGALSAGYVADRIGRRNAIILGSAIYTIGVVPEMVAPIGGTPVMVVGRAVAGFGVGVVSASTIMYVSEITPKQIRGSIMGAYQLAITSGILFAACVSIGTQSLLSSAAYRIVIGVQFLWALWLGLGLLFMPESPRWFMMKGKEEKAKKALAQIYRRSADSDFVEQEYKVLEESYQAEMAAGAANASFLDCFKGGFNRGSNLHRTFIGTSIQMFQQLTGVNFIFYYGTTFFQRAGISNPFVISLIVAAVNTASTPMALWAIERFGRRKLLITGAMGMTICELIVAIIGTVLPNAHVAQNVLITFVCIYIFFFAATWGPCAWTVCGEIFPQRTRSQGTALSTASNWFFNFLISFVAPYLVDQDHANLGPKIFFIFGACTIACGFFAKFVIYETQGLSLEQTDMMMKEVSARESPKWWGRTGLARVDSPGDSPSTVSTRKPWGRKSKGEESPQMEQVEQARTSSSAPSGANV
ncbi:hypothetical protein EG329_010724 [Mollisiaceae sp. DMI_Dod_QoI]|nr:hypothetical protein EG329_010724 [Helotiales sp. DMI_Dod_QoI]